VPSVCQITCDIECTLSFVGAVDADHDVAWEDAGIWYGSCDENRAGCLVEQFAGDSTEDDLLQASVTFRPDGEQGRLEALHLLEERVDREPFESAQIGLRPEDLCRRCESRACCALETFGEIVHSESFRRRGREQRNDGCLDGGMRLRELGCLAAGV
jgi:hypothetical protein